jgi:predicted FMN-binding regulatory protein PaiB
MRQAFEAWAQRDGHIVRRREDKPEEYLVFETQRRWLIWQAALAHGQAAAEAAQKPAQTDAQPQKMVADEAAVRNRVLNEVLDAFSELDDNAGVEGIVKVIQGLKKKARSQAEEKV